MWLDSSDSTFVSHGNVFQDPDDFELPMFLQIIILNWFVLHIDLGRIIYLVTTIYLALCEVSRHFHSFPENDMQQL